MSFISCFIAFFVRMLRIDGFRIAQASLALLSLNRIWPRHCPLNIPIWHWPIPNHSQYCPSLLPSLCSLENRRQILSNPYLLLVSGDYLKLQLLTKASNYCFTVISTLQSVVGKLNVSHWESPIVDGKSSFTSTCNTLAISTKVPNDGWLRLVHHFYMVTSPLPSCSASHLLVLCFSTKTTLILFRPLLFIERKFNAPPKVLLLQVKNEEGVVKLRF